MLPIHALLVGGISLGAGLPERRPLPGSNLRQQRSVCHIPDLTGALVMKPQHPDTLRVFSSK